MVKICACGHSDTIHRKPGGCFGDKPNGEPCECMKFRENKSASDQVSKDAEEGR